MLRIIFTIFLSTFRYQTLLFKNGVVIWRDFLDNLVMWRFDGIFYKSNTYFSLITISIDLTICCLIRFGSLTNKDCRTSIVDFETAFGTNSGVLLKYKISKRILKQTKWTYHGLSAIKFPHVPCKSNKRRKQLVAFILASLMTTEVTRVFCLLTYHVTVSKPNQN